MKCPKCPSCCYIALMQQMNFLAMYAYDNKTLKDTPFDMYGIMYLPNHIIYMNCSIA